MVEYYKNLKKTKKDYNQQGFFHTGDIYQFTKDGIIQIINCKKNLVKLKGGEYTDTLCAIANGVLDSFLVVVITNNCALEQWAKSQGILYNSVDKLAKKEEVQKEAIKSIVAKSKKVGLTNLG